MYEDIFNIMIITIILIILINYFFYGDDNIYKEFGNIDSEDSRKYEKRERFNPLYRNGNLRKKRGKYDCFSEIKGFYMAQIAAIIYMVVCIIYLIVQYFFKVRNDLIENFLLISGFFFMIVGFLLGKYYNFIIEKITNERNLTKEAKVLIYEIIGDLEKQKISFLKKYVTPDLYSTLEKNSQNQNNRGKYKIKQIKLVNEKENQDHHKEIWYEIMLVRMKFHLMEQGEYTVQYWKFVDKEEKLLADEILRDGEYQKKKS